MKEKFAEFLLKRIGNKIGEARDFSNYEELTVILDDLDTYTSALKDILKEVLMP